MCVPPSDLRYPLSHPLEALGPIAEWQVFEKFPMPMEEIHLPNGSLFRLPLGPVWLSPFTLPAGLVRAFDGVPASGRLTPGATDWTRCAVADWETESEGAETVPDQPARRRRSDCSLRRWQSSDRRPQSIGCARNRAETGPWSKGRTLEC